MACGLLLPGFADAQDLSAKPASFAGELTEGVKAGRVVNKYYADEDLEDNRNQREPVAKAMPSPAVRRKRADRVTADGHPLRRWDGIVSALSTIARNTCRGGEGKTAFRFTRDTEPDAYHSRIFELLTQDGPAWPGKCAQ